MMRYLTGILVALGVSMSAAWANDAPMTLDKVRFQVTAKDWVRTDRAKLTLGVDMTLNNADMVQARTDILRNLEKIAEGTWHITQFQRSQDSSGLEKLSVIAQSRVKQTALSNVYDQTKKVSKPGATYRVNSIDFSPGFADREAVKNTLRERLYKKVQAELDKLNAAYPEQHYTLNRLVFAEGKPSPENLAKTRLDTFAMGAAAAPSPAISVSDQLILTAVASVASNRQEVEDKKND